MAVDDSVFEGKTLDDAVRKGLEALGLSRAEVMITMIEEGSGGFLGIGSRPYRVRVMPRPGGAIRDYSDRAGRGDRDRRPRGGRGTRPAERPAAGADRGRGSRDGARRSATSQSSGEPRGARNAERSGRGRIGRPAAAGGSEARPSRPSGGERRPRDPLTRSASDSGEPRRAPQGVRGRSRGFQEERGRETHAPEMTQTGERRMRGEERYSEPSAHAPARTFSAVDEVPAWNTDQLAAEGRRRTEELLKLMGFEATVTATAEDNRVDVTATIPEGEELLTGRKGEVRQGLQHVLNLMLNREQSTRYHLQLEINDFWVRRESELQELARTLADEALLRGSEAVTEYLNAQERRVVHMTLKEDSRVKTYALGTGLIKRVAIAPADFPHQTTEVE
jgi:spoIIIJ-associated protein